MPPPRRRSDRPQINQSDSRYFQISNEFGGHPYVASEIGGNTLAKGDVRRPKQ
jgi:hypothetical protein